MPQIVVEVNLTTASVGSKTSALGTGFHERLPGPSYTRAFMVAIVRRKRDEEEKEGVVVGVVVVMRREHVEARPVADRMKEKRSINDEEKIACKLQAKAN